MKSRAHQAVDVLALGLDLGVAEERVAAAAAGADAELALQHVDLVEGDADVVVFGLQHALDDGRLDDGQTPVECLLGR